MNGVFGSKITGSLNSNAVLRNKLAEIAEIAKARKRRKRRKRLPRYWTRVNSHALSNSFCITSRLYCLTAPSRLF